MSNLKRETSYLVKDQLHVAISTLRKLKTVGTSRAQRKTPGGQLPQPPTANQGESGQRVVREQGRSQQTSSLTGSALTDKGETELSKPPFMLENVRRGPIPPAWRPPI